MPCELARHVAVRALYDRDNDYLWPGWYVTHYIRKVIRRSLSTRLYEPLEGDHRPFVYFPLHLTDDYKIRRVVPHCAQQDAIVEQVAAALPQGHDLVLKEHPLSIGWNPVGMLRRLSAIENVRLVHPRTSSHQLIRRAVNVLRNDAAYSVSVLSLRLVGGTDIDLQHGTRRYDRGQARNCVDRPLYSQKTLLD